MKPLFFVAPENPGVMLGSEATKQDTHSLFCPAAAALNATARVTIKLIV